jgi:hypothetical protein
MNLKKVVRPPYMTNQIFGWNAGDLRRKIRCWGDGGDVGGRMKILPGAVPITLFPDTGIR